MPRSEPLALDELLELALVDSCALAWEPPPPDAVPLAVPLALALVESCALAWEPPPPDAVPLAVE